MLKRKTPLFKRKNHYKGQRTRDKGTRNKAQRTKYNPLNIVFVLACEFWFFCPKGAGFFFFIRGSAKGAEEWHDEFGCKLAYKQRHHAMTRTGEQPDTYKKGLFSVFVLRELDY